MGSAFTADREETILEFRLRNVWSKDFKLTDTKVNKVLKRGQNTERENHD
tara:strand:- start:26794 stop:26943 length:150 start_codon:yes stop_codon:yes gene_type:complete